MALVPVYFNNFDDSSDPLKGGTSQTSGTNVGVLNADPLTLVGNQYVMFSGIDENAGLEANVEPDPDTKYSEIDIFATIDFFDGNGPWVNGEPDGISFNYGDPNTLFPSAEEEGIFEGLAVKLSPIQDTMAIFWNGEELASITVLNLSSYGPTSFGVQVAADGTVTAFFAGNGTSSDPDFTVSATIPNGEWLTADQTGWDVLFAGRTGDNGGTGYIDNIGIQANVVCFAQDTFIQTTEGTKKVQDLQVGDMVETYSSGPQEIHWIGRRQFNKEDLRQNPKLLPVKIAKGSLGKNIPENDLWVSRQHRMILQSKIIEKMFDAPQVFAPAITLVDLNGVEVDENVESVTYFHFMCQKHEIVIANGALTESLYFGEQTIKTLPPESVEEIYSIFPELLCSTALPAPAAKLSENKQAKQAIKRHIKNNKPAQIAF